nr:Z protein [Songea mammarenavirus]
MGGKTSRPQERGDKTGRESPRAELLADATHLGPQFCKSCWFERKSLVACSNHYLCLNCLTLLLTVSDRCPICKLPLPQRIRLTTPPSAPAPPPYEP